MPAIPQSEYAAVYAIPSPSREAAKAVAAIREVSSTARTGTPRLLILAKNFGASPFSAICCIVLEAAYNFRRKALRSE